MKLFLIFLIALNYSNAVVFDCTFVSSSWTIIGTRYTCRANVTNSLNSNVLEDVLGDHLVSRTNADVEVLDVNSQKLNYIPRNIASFFINLRGLQLFRTNLISISSDDLMQFPNLLSLMSWHNELFTLDGDLFEHTERLQFIRFFNNSITNVGYEFLDDLDDLQRVNFQSNFCIDFDADTPVRIQQLKLQLLLQCTPLSTTSLATTTLSTTEETSLECSPECLTYIEEIQAEVTELSTTTVELKLETQELRTDTKYQSDEIFRLNIVSGDQANKINELESKVLSLASLNNLYEERLVELEKQMREIKSSPCSCS